jgi:hypothetical protein
MVSPSFQHSRVVEEFHLKSPTSATGHCGASLPTTVQFRNVTVNPSPAFSRSNADRRGFYFNEANASGEQARAQVYWRNIRILPNLHMTVHFVSATVV